MSKDMTVPCEDGLINLRVGAIIMKNGKDYLVCKYSGKSKNVNVCLFDKITTAERGMKDTERYLTLNRFLWRTGEYR